MNHKYVLITPARNEELYIEKTIQSVISQTILPEKWIIVSDNSTDRTDEIVKQYANKYFFIELLRRNSSEIRDFGSKIKAFNAGYELVKDLDYQYIGLLDADISFEHEYFSCILEKLAYNPNLGIAGGIIVEKINGNYIPQNISTDSVAGAVQLFNRSCFEEIDGFLPIIHGGEDSVAEIMARMKGWEVRTFTEYKVVHYRRVSTATGNILRGRFKQGSNFYRLGYHPLFIFARCLIKIKERPYFLGSALVLLGYIWSFLKRSNREVPLAVISFLRSEQLKKISKRHR